MRADLIAAISRFEEHGDIATEAAAWRVIAAIDSSLGNATASVQALQRVIDLASQAGDTRLANRAAAALANVMGLSAVPAQEVSARCTGLLEQVSGDRKAEAIILSTAAVAEAMQGHFEAARDLLRRSGALVADLGRSTLSATQSLEASQVEMLAGEPAVAVSLLRADDKALEAMGERHMRPVLTGLLAHALEAIGEDEEGLRFAELARELSDAEDTDAQVVWRTAEAKILSRSGDAATARALVEEALEMAGGSDLLDLQGNAAADAALVYARLGLESESRAQLGSARELFMQKENVAAIALIEGRLASVASVS
jgi:ATP/maltotriose-dependent transcriptional regulator MalT